VANAAYIWIGAKGNLRKAGASVAHVGFGMMLLGILISSAKKNVLSYNTTGMNPFSAESTENPMENLTLIRNTPTDMGKFTLTYENDTMNFKENKRFFHVRFRSKDGKEEFVMKPDLIRQKKSQSYIANPDYQNYWNKDVFVYLTYYVPKAEEDTSQFKVSHIKAGDTLYYSNGFMILNRIDGNPNNDRYHFTSADTALMADVTVISKDGRRYKARPALQVKNNQYIPIADTVISQSLVLAFTGVDENNIHLGVKESSTVLDFITLKAYEFPFINLLWLGTIIMVAGFFISIVQRVRKK
jgi:cytochrome c-type biogenesis protein CcmF